jgi:hypothetical protein
MIVKNESKIIKRLLKSVIDIIDYYVICDTGSTDNTVEIIENFFKESKIRGFVFYEKFINFCHNRNIALQHSKGLTEYALLLDADMVLEVNSKDFTLTENSYKLSQGSDYFYYDNIRIVKNNGTYYYVGVTHEYITCSVNDNPSKIPKEILFIRDLGDGGAKSDKFERDRRLLLEGISAEPNNERYHFYLANTLRDLGNNQESIEYYKKRIELGGWYEEKYVSCLNIYKLNGDLSYLVESFHYNPKRVEGILELIKYYTIKKQYQTAYNYYTFIKEYYENEYFNGNGDISKNLFSNALDYSYYLPYYMIIVCGYIKNNDTGLFMYKVIFKRKSYLSEWHHKNLFYNLQFYTFDNNFRIQIFNYLESIKPKDLYIRYYKYTLSPMSIIVLSNNLTIKDITFRSSSSSLVKNNSGYILNTRYVNYYITGNGSYTNTDKGIITINEYKNLDNNFNTLDSYIEDFQGNTSWYHGIEDIRLFYDYQNTLRFIGNYFGKCNKICVVTGNYTLNEKKELTHTEFVSNKNCEKNWVFVNYKKNTYIIYNWFPITIYDQNTFKLFETKKVPTIFQHIRGSTCGYNFNNEIWFVVHIVSYETPREYYHLICVFSENMDLLRYTSPFKFENESIEYCLSVIVNENNVIMNYSTWDRTTKIGIYNKNDLIF